MPDLPLTITSGALPINMSYTPQEFADALVARLKISSSQAFALFTSGAVLPTSDTGPHFLTTESTWYYFDYGAGSYQPIKLRPKSLRYIISSNPPSNEDYDVWYRVAADGTPLDIRKYQNGQWTPYPIDYANVSNKPNIAPIGEILMWPTASAPQDFLTCNGQAVLRGQYSDLFNVLGTTYGSGDGVNTFNLPDFSGRSPVGFGSSGTTGSLAWGIGQKRGASAITQTADQLPAHKHDWNLTQWTGDDDAAAGSGTTSARILMATNRGVRTGECTVIGLSNKETGSGEPMNIENPGIGINFIIRYKNTN